LVYIKVIFEVSQRLLNGGPMFDAIGDNWICPSKSQSLHNVLCKGLSRGVR